MSIKIIVKYEVNKPFTDKYTKEDVKSGSIIEIDVERMKTLNEHNVGRVIDIIAGEEPISPSADSKEEEREDDLNSKEKYSQEELNALTVNELKDLATKMKIELTKAKKDEIIEEILQNQK